MQQTNYKKSRHSLLTNAVLLALGLSCQSRLVSSKPRMDINMKTFKIQDSPTYKERYFPVPIDHFDNRVSNVATF